MGEEHYLVRRERACPDCNGCGYTSHPVYAEFAAAAAQWEAENPRPRGQDLGEKYSAAWDEYRRRLELFESDWFAAHGYPGGPRAWPCEECFCYNCKGSGTESREVDLMEALRALGVEPGGKE